MLGHYETLDIYEMRQLEILPNMIKCLWIMC